MRFILDTNISIYIIKKKPRSVLEKLKIMKTSDIGISSIVHAELEYGIEKSAYALKNREALMELLIPLEIAPFDERAAKHYGEIRASFEKKGDLIVAMDILIAAHARSLNLPLVTNNTKEFMKVPGQKVENWAIARK